MLSSGFSSSFSVQKSRLHFHVQQRAQGDSFGLLFSKLGCPDLQGAGGTGQLHHPTAPEMRGCANPLPQISARWHYSFSLCTSTSNTFHPLSSRPGQAVELQGAGERWPHDAEEGSPVSSPCFSSAGQHRDAGAGLRPNAPLARGAADRALRCPAASLQKPAAHHPASLQRMHPAIA